MESKSELNELDVELAYNELAGELQYNVAQYFPPATLTGYALASKGHFKLFKPLLDQVKRNYAQRVGIHDFLLHVVRGEHEAVKAMLAKNIRLLFIRGEVKDCSGRTFTNISGFEYALWALDKHMWTTMIECIPLNEEGSKKIIEILLYQYKKINTEGITYQFEEKTITKNKEKTIIEIKEKTISEKHFDFENTIIRALKTQVYLLDTFKFDEKAISMQFIRGVGGAERKFPMHLVYEWCSKIPFTPIPPFISQPPSSRQFFNRETANREDWFEPNSKLGIDFALRKGEAGFRTCSAATDGNCRFAHNDLAAMEDFFEKRTKDLIELKSRLLDKHAAIKPDNQSEVITSGYQ